MIPFHHIQTQCQPHITEAAKSSVEGICKKMYNLSCDYAQKVKEKNAEILKEANISGNLFYILAFQKLVLSKILAFDSNQIFCKNEIAANAKLAKK